MRRARVMQALLLQGFLALILIGLAIFQRHDRFASTLFLVTLIVPIGWAYAFWSGDQREAAARREGRWDAKLAVAERKRAMGILGGSLFAWILTALALAFVL